MNNDMVDNKIRKEAIEAFFGMTEEEYNKALNKGIIGKNHKIDEEMIKEYKKSLNYFCNRMIELRNRMIELRDNFFNKIIGE